MNRNVFALFGAVAVLLTATVALTLSRATPFASGIGGLKCYDIKGGIGKCSVDRPILTDQVRRDMRLIALPTSDGGSIAPVGIFAAIRRASLEKRPPSLTASHAVLDAPRGGAWCTNGA